MRLLLLSNHLSIHTIKWAMSLSERKIEILIFSLSSGETDVYKKADNISVISGDYSFDTIRSEGLMNKAQYLSTVPRLKKVIKTFNPDIVHAHYATSYGLLGALSGFHPLIISVWGSDVFDFPSNRLTTGLLQFNLERADRILSTSEVMAEETNKYVDKTIHVTPFGIDIEKFRPMEIESPFPKGSIVIGTIKSLEQKYGVEYLIRAFKLLKDDHPELPVKLLIVGTGTQEGELKHLTKCLELEDDTIFTGMVDHTKVPEYMNMLDIYVAVSTLASESFGVAILEASACEVPVIVSRVGGLPEVVQEGETGVIINPKSVNELTDAMYYFIENPEMMIKMGKNGRRRVVDNYRWNVCVNKMMEIYSNVLDKELV